MLETRECYYHKNKNDCQGDKVQSFDLTGRLFCSLETFQKFYQEKNQNNLIESTHDELFRAQLLDRQRSDDSFIKDLEVKSIDERKKIIESTILDLQRIQKLIRESELSMAKHLMILKDSVESEKTERYRKAGVNSDVELKEKKLSKMQKMITSYKKMNMSLELVIETILLASQGKITREQIISEWEGL